MRRLGQGLLLALGLLLCAPALASAQNGAPTGILGVSVGATSLEQTAGTTWHPSLRAELLFEVLGPVYLGGFVTGLAEEPVFVSPSLGGGVVAQIRPDLPVLGLHPHLEGSFARLQLPSERMGRVDGWASSVGGGLAPELDEGLRLEFRVVRTWYHGLPQDADVADASWTGTVGLSVDLL